MDRHALSFLNRQHSTNLQSSIPNSLTLFAHDFIDHGLCVGGRVGAGTVAAYMGGSLAFDDLQAIGVPGKFSQTFGIGV